MVQKFCNLELSYPYFQPSPDLQSFRYKALLYKINYYSAIKHRNVLIDFSLTVKAATLIFISGRGSAIPSAKEGKSGFIYNLVKS